MRRKAFGYLRVSTQKQTDGDGFPRQRQAIEAHAPRAGLRVTSWYEEAFTGTEAERPVWVGMIQAALEQGVDVILVEKLDRLARDLMVQEWIVEDCRKRGIELLSTYESDLADDPNNPTRRLVRRMMGLIHEYEKCMLVIKLRTARQRKKALTGKADGRHFYGEHPKRPEERAAVARILELRKAGKTLQQTADSLNAERVPTRLSGRRWWPMTVANVLKRQAR